MSKNGAASIVVFGGKKMTLGDLCRIYARERGVSVKRWISIGKPIEVHFWLFVPPYAWKKRSGDIDRWIDAARHAYPRLWRIERNMAQRNAHVEAIGKTMVVKVVEVARKRAGWWERENLPSAGTGEIKGALKMGGERCASI